MIDKIKSFNTDGVSLFKSSHVDILWPVYLVINKLPALVRYILVCLILSIYIMEYGSIPYVGMARGKNGCRICPVQNHIFKTLL